MIGQPARRYAEKFPEEFFDYMDTDTTGKRYKSWVTAIFYSGLYNGEDYRELAQIRAAVISTMKRNCRNVTPTLITRIQLFAQDCFPDNLREKDI